MKYKEGKDLLIKLFKDHSFIELSQKKEFRTKSIKIDECSNGTEIHVTFPGIKTRFNDQNKILNYDYRVDLISNNIETALSHANIITDLYYKGSFKNLDIQKLKSLLKAIAKDEAFDVKTFPEYLHYNISKINTVLLNDLERYHKNLGKPYNRNGNIHELNFEELTKSIQWIVLQEDINYPITKGKKGRRMPFERYLETLYCSTRNAKHTLEEVVTRALAHSRPLPWQEIDYTWINDLK